MSFEPGKHTVRLLDYGVSQSSGGKPQVFAQFSRNGETITWYGGTKEERAEGKTDSQWGITLKSLKVMGYEGDPSAAGTCAKLWGGPPDGGLKVDDYDIVTGWNEYKDFNGVMQKNMKVNFINKVGEGGGVGKKFESREEMMKAFSSGSKSPGSGTGNQYFE